MTSTGIRPCTPCPGDAVTTVVGKNSVADCLCDAGFWIFTLDWTCHACSATMCTPEIADAHLCNECPASHATYKLAANSVSDCVCPSGPEMDDATNDFSGCHECGYAFYNPHRNGTCLDCPADSSSAFSGNTECECGPGFYMITDAAGNPAECLLCAAGTYSSGYGNTCDPCPETTTSNAGVTSLSQCVCDSGWFRTSAEGDTLTCGTCNNANIFQPTHNVHTTCLACPSRSSSASTGFKGCMCTRGYHMVLADGLDISLQQCELYPLNTSAPVDNAMGTCKLCDPYANPKPV